MIFLPIMIVTLPLPSQIVKVWPEEMVSFLMWFAFWSFAGLLTVPWLFCIYQLVTHQLGRTKRIKQLLDEDSAPKVVIVMPCYKEELDVLITAINSVVECDYPPSCIHVFLSFDGDQEDELFLNTIERLGVPLTLESYPKSIDVAYKDARITVSRFPHGGKRTCQKATYKLIDRVYTEYLKRNDNLFILFIDSDCILDRVCLQNFLYDMEFSPGNRRNMLAMTGVITSTTKKHSIITLLQDMEYIHGQLFERTVESGCGSVTCLPGALTMLRFSAFRRMAKYYFADKAETCEDLFDFAKDHLGEDRYLTHLFMIGAKERYQIQMCTSAFCKTEAVQTYKSLVKQRRRWFLGFITNEACMLTDWRLWRRYPILVAYRFCQNTIRTTALLFFIMVLALLSTEKSINDLPVGFIAISLGLNWLMMVYFGAKLRRYKIWLYPMMFVLNPFFNWYYMVYGIFTAGQRTWGGPRADAGAADKNTTVQEAIEHAEQTGDDLNVVPETFIPAVMAQHEEHVAKTSSGGGDGTGPGAGPGPGLGLDRRAASRRKSRSRRDGLGRQRSVVQPPPQVEGLFTAPQRVAGGFYKFLDPAGDPSGSLDSSSSATGPGTSSGNEGEEEPRRRGVAGGIAKGAPGSRDVEVLDSDASSASNLSGLDRGKMAHDHRQRYTTTTAAAPVAVVAATTPMAPYRDEPSSPVYMPSGAPPPGPDMPLMGEEDRRKYEMAQARQASNTLRAQAQQRLRPKSRLYQFLQRSTSSLSLHLHAGGGSPGSPSSASQQEVETVEMGETGYAETLPGTPVNAALDNNATTTAASSSATSPPRRAGSLVVEGPGGGGRGGSSRNSPDWEAGQSLLMPPSEGSSRARRRSPLGRELFAQVPFEEDDGDEEADEADGMVQRRREGVGGRR